jgi:hypothetical protein
MQSAYRSCSNTNYRRIGHERTTDENDAERRSERRATKARPARRERPRDQSNVRECGYLPCCWAIAVVLTWMWPGLSLS